MPIEVLLHSGQPAHLILHAFIKKTEQTPQRELETARARWKEVKQ